MNVRTFFKTRRTEARLIDCIAIFYFLKIVIYTADDFKQTYPAYLVLLGLIVHTVAVMTWFDENRRKSFFCGHKWTVYKLVPIGLTLLYSLSYFEGERIGADMRGLPTFLLTAIPMVLYLFSIAYKPKAFALLRDRRQVYNISFVLLFIIVTSLGKHIN